MTELLNQVKWSVNLINWKIPVHFISIYTDWSDVVSGITHNTERNKSREIELRKNYTTIKQKVQNICFTPLQMSYLKLEVLIDFWLQSMSPGRTDWKPISPESHFFPCASTPYIVLSSFIETASLILTETCQRTYSAFMKVWSEMSGLLKSLATVLLR